MNFNNNRDTKKFLICFTAIIFIMGIFSFANINKSTIFFKDKTQEAAQFTSENKTNNEEENTSDKVSRASFLAVGDVMVYNVQLKSQYDANGSSYDFKNNFEYIKKYVEQADYSMANLETTLTGNSIYKFSAYPKFNSPDELADGLKYAGFDLISTANNHAYDKGDLSIKNTLSTLKSKNLDVIGTKEDNDKRFIVKELNGINIGITSYTYGKIINDDIYLGDTKLSDEYKDSINVFDSTSVDTAFENINSTLKNMNNTDLQIVYLHWGDKYQLNENTFQKQLAQKLCEAGVDLIIGSHPHVVQSVTSIKSSDGTHETIVAYSLGNLLSNQTRDNKFSKYTEDGLMLSIDITKNNNQAKITKINCIPTWLNKYYNSQTSKYVFEAIPLANKSDLDKMSNLNKSYAEQSYNNTAKQVKTSDIISIVENPFK